MAVRIYKETWAVRIVETGLLAIVLILPTWFNPWSAMSFEPPKVMLLRLLVLVLIACWLIGRKRILARWYQVVPQRVQVGIGLVLALVVVYSAATLVSIAPQQSLLGQEYWRGGLLTYLCEWSAFLLTITTMRRPRLAKQLCTTVVIGSIPPVLYALIQMAHLDPITWYTAYPGRVFSSLGNPNILGGYLAMVFPLTLAQWRDAKVRRRRHAYAVLGVAQVVALLSTGSRGAWLATVAALLVLMLARLSRRRLAKSLFLALMLLLIVATLFRPDPTATGKARLLIWQGSLPLVAARPWLGYGPETFALVFPSYSPPALLGYGADKVITDHAHNLWFDIAAEAGLLAVTMWVVFLVLLVKNGQHKVSHDSSVNRWQFAAILAALLAYIVQNQFTFPTVVTATLFWILSGASLVFCLPAQEPKSYSYAATGENFAKQAQPAHLTPMTSVSMSSRPVPNAIPLTQMGVPEQVRSLSSAKRLDSADAWIGVSLLGLTMLFFWRLVFTSQILSGLDVVTYFYPYREYATLALRMARLPLWNPYLFLGVPFLANIQSAVFYPLHWPLLILDIPTQVKLSIVLHVFLGGLFTYLFARISMGLSRFGAFICAVAFACSGWLGAQAEHLNQLNTAIWLPLLLLFLERGCIANSRVFIPLGGGVVALMILAGHPQITYMVLVATGLYTLVLFHRKARSTSQSQLKVGLTVASSLILVLVIGLGLAAIQILPSLELWQFSVRSYPLNSEQATSYSLTPDVVLSSLLPTYGRLPFREEIGFVGVGILILAFWGAIFSPKRTHRLYALALVAIGLLLAMGSHSIFYRAGYDIVPGVGFFKAPARWLYLYTFGVALLAGLGGDFVMRSAVEKASILGCSQHTLSRFSFVRILTGLVLLIGFFLIAWPFPKVPSLPICWVWVSLALVTVIVLFIGRVWFPRNVFQLSVCLAVLVELFIATRGLDYNHLVPYEAYSKPMPTVHTLRSQSNLDRIVNLATAAGTSQSSLENGFGTGALSESQLLLARREAIVPNLGMLERFYTLDGYDGGLLPLRMYAEFQRKLVDIRDIWLYGRLHDQARSIPSLQVIGMLNGRYLLLDGSDPLPTQEERLLRPLHDGSISIYENVAALPRAFIAHRARVIEEEKEVLATIFAPTFEPTQEVVLFPPGQPIAAVTPLANVERVDIVEYTPEHIFIEVEALSEGYLVLADTFYPGWCARVDGQPVEILRADYLLRAVRLSPGIHKVVFSYEPGSFQRGLTISLFSICSTGLWLVTATWSLLRVKQKTM